MTFVLPKNNLCIAKLDVYWGMRKRCDNIYLPAVFEVIPYILQVGVSHVLDAEYEDMLVLIDAVSDLGEELLVVFPAGLLPRFGEGYNLVALAFGHCGCCETLAID